MYKSIVKPILFKFHPEKAHNITTSLFGTLTGIPIINSIVKSVFGYENKSLGKKLLGLKFKNPVGLAAGFDKDGKYYESMEYLGFGFIEIGTVTPLPQSGNPTPRLFRLPEDEALINRMGFNNDGVVAMVQRLKYRKKSDVLIGGNIGKNKVTPNDEAVKDYVKCYQALHLYVDYFVVNVSSPNTPGLRELQEKGPLTHILKTLLDLNKEVPTPRPILLKIAPDVTEGQLVDIVDIIKELSLPGIIATNTTISREGLENENKSETGGLSGLPVQKRSTEVIRFLRQNLPDETVIIGVGGINSADSAKEKIEAGADLIQVYSGLVFEGPSLIKDIKKGLV